MEPIYAILIVLILGWFRGETPEKMSAGFYIGTVIILGSIFINAYLKRKKNEPKKIGNIDWLNELKINNRLRTELDFLLKWGLFHS
jgi:hypothetical protein